MLAAPPDFKDPALNYGSLVALLWGVGVSFGAFNSPQTIDWGEWCALLVGGIAAALAVPLAVAAAADWIARRRADHQPQG